SALVSALDVVAGDSGDTTSLRHAAGEAAAQVTASFCLSQAERMSVLARSPRRDQLLADGAVASLDFVFTEPLRGQGSAGLGLTQIRSSWPSHGMQTLAGLMADPNGVARAVVLSALTADTDASGMSGVSLQGRAVDWLDRMMPALDQTQSWAGILAEWRSRFYHFRALRSGTQRVQSLASADRLDPTGTNLSAVLLYLATDRPALFNRLRSLIAEIVPHIGSLEVRTGGGQLRVVFDTASGDLNLKDLGTGVEQLLMTLVVGLMEAPPFTLVVEEPETNLHPAGQRALLGHLQVWAEDRQIIAATHSPVMLNWSPGGDRLWHVTRSDNDSQVAMVDADPLPLLSSLGVQLSDVLSADRVLVLEGPSDQDVLVVWFPEVLRSPRVAV